MNLTSNLEKDKFINDLVKVHNSSEIPFIIFNGEKMIFHANKAFMDRFFSHGEKTFIGREINFLFAKKEKSMIAFSALDIEKILEGDQIFSYFPKDKDEVFFYISTFVLCRESNCEYFYSIIKEITELEEKLMEESIRALVIASQLKDNDTGNHIRRVNAYSYAMAKHLYKTRGENYPEIDHEFIEKIFKVASLHDVGKIGTPDYIITKPGKLTEDEFQIMKEHTINGAFILSRMAGQMARDIALFHHERWDGTGYPYQIKGEQIPLSARIVSIADVYDALRMKRHYKPSFPHEKTRQMIFDNRGKHFDPDLIDCFMEIELEFKDIYEKMKDPEEVMGFHSDFHDNTGSEKF
jgi:HD-GYP domain-containing protein (c-di-GMP phosphodiesterase class II)